MKSLLSALLLLLTLSLSALGQSTLSGRVVTQDASQGIPSVSISIMDAETRRIIGGGFTDKSGAFAIPLSESILSRRVTLTLSHLSYEKWSTTDLARQLSGRTYTLKSRQKQLKEVVVKATTVSKRGDTIRYSAGQLMKLGDHTLEDVIKRIPGMKVSSSGQITYEGKSINKFYIEGLDLMGGKYALATKNVKADDVAAVEVLENHEPVKMKKDRSLSDQAALNIRMKESAKNTWTYALTTGLGINRKGTPLALGDGSAYIFNKGYQAMAIAKGTNNGTQIFSELNTLALDEVVISQASAQREVSDFFDTSADIGDNVVRDRGRINTSALTSLNYIKKLSEDSKWRLNANFGLDLAHRAYSETTLFRTSPTEVRTLEDAYDLRRREQLYEIESNYRLNEDRRYVKVQTQALVSIKDLKSTLSSNSHPYTSHTVAPSGQITNTASWSRKYGSHTLSISDDFALDHLPQQLSLAPPTPLGGIDKSIVQDATTTHLYNTLKISYEHHAGRKEYKLSAALSYEGERRDTHLHFPLLASDSIPLSGRMYANDLTLSVTPSFIYRLKRWRFVCDPHITLSMTRVRDLKGRDSTMSRHKAWLSPSASIAYQGTSIDWYLGGGYGHTPSRATALYRPYIFRGLHDISHGSQLWWHDTSTRLWQRLTYKDLFNFFSTVYTASYTHTSSPISRATRLQDLYRIHSFVPMAHRAESFVHDLSLQKIFRSIGVTTHLTLNHHISSSESVQQGQLYKYLTQAVSVSPMVEWQISPRLSLKYSGDMGRSFFRLHSESKYQTQESQIHSLSIFAKPASKLLLNAHGKLYRTQSPMTHGGRPHDFYVFDASAEWSLPWATLILSARNLGVDDRYRIERHNTLNAYTAHYHLRPSEVFLTLRWHFKGTK